MTADEGPPRGGLARTARLAALPAAFAGRTAIGIGKRLSGRPPDVVTAQVPRRTADQLNGGAMKVGQVLSAMESALPEQLAGPYREALVRLQEAAPPMPTALVHLQLDRAFPDGWRHLLRDLGDRPVAAASVGQVHRATWSDGTPVAVKVQYPRRRRRRALLTDVGTLSGLAPVLRAAAPGLDARQLIAELRDRLLVRLLTSSPVCAGRLHGDPHPGNFRLLPDGRLVVLDFGATEALPHGWPARLGPFLAAGRDGDDAALHRLAVTFGLAPQDLPPAALAGSARTVHRFVRRTSRSPAAGCGSRPGGCPIRSAPPLESSAG